MKRLSPVVYQLKINADELNLTSWYKVFLRVWTQIEAYLNPYKPVKNNDTRGKGTCLFKIPTSQDYLFSNLFDIVPSLKKLRSN